MTKCSSFLIILLSLASSLFVGNVLGQATEEVVYLNNGWVLRGQVDQTTRPNAVIIHTRDGNIFVFATQEVDSMRTEIAFRKLKPQFVYQTKGGNYFADLSLFFSSGGNVNWDWGNTGLALQAGYSWRFKHWLSVGAGAGFNFYARGPIAPIVLDLRGDFAPKRQSWFYQIQAGYGFRMYDLTTDGWWNPEVLVQRGGLHYSGGLGVKFHAAGGAAMLFTVAYRIQHAYEFQDWGEGQSKVETFHTLRRLSLGIGTMF